jgi:hypothetical protein
MLSGINLALMTAFAALNTLYLLRRRTRILTAQLHSGVAGAESTP